MEQMTQKRNNVWAWLTLICGGICLGCLLYFLYTRFICWSEFSPLAGALTLIFFCSFIAGPLSALLSLVFGCVGAIREDRRRPGESRRNVAFSIFGIVSGALYLIGVLIFFFIVL